MPKPTHHILTLLLWHFHLAVNWDSVQFIDIMQLFISISLTWIKVAIIQLAEVRAHISAAKELNRDIIPVHHYTIIDEVHNTRWCIFACRKECMSSLLYTIICNNAMELVPLVLVYAHIYAHLTTHDNNNTNFEGQLHEKLLHLRSFYLLHG